MKKNMLVLFLLILTVLPGASAMAQQRFQDALYTTKSKDSSACLKETYDKTDSLISRTRELDIFLSADSTSFRFPRAINLKEYNDPRDFLADHTMLSWIEADRILWRGPYSYYGPYGAFGPYGSFWGGAYGYYNPYWNGLYGRYWRDPYYYIAYDPYFLAQDLYLDQIYPWYSAAWSSMYDYWNGPFGIWRFNLGYPYLADHWGVQCYYPAVYPVDNGNHHYKNEHNTPSTGGSARSLARPVVGSGSSVMATSSITRSSGAASASTSVTSNLRSESSAPSAAGSTVRYRYSAASSADGSAASGSTSSTSTRGGSVSGSPTSTRTGGAVTSYARSGASSNYSTEASTRGSNSMGYSTSASSSFSRSSYSGSSSSSSSSSHTSSSAGSGGGGSYSHGGGSGGGGRR